MLTTSINLPNSYDHGPCKFLCAKCGSNRPEKDGVYMGQKFICGSCWRLKATKKANAATRSMK